MERIGFKDMFVLFFAKKSYFLSTELGFMIFVYNTVYGKKKRYVKTVIS